MKSTVWFQTKEGFHPFNVFNQISQFKATKVENQVNDGLTHKRFIHKRTVLSMLADRQRNPRTSKRKSLQHYRQKNKFLNFLYQTKIPHNKVVASKASHSGLLRTTKATTGGVIASKPRSDLRYSSAEQETEDR